MKSEILINSLKYSSPWSATDIVKQFVADNSDREVLETIRELSRKALQDQGDYYLATLASMLKQAAGLQIGPPEAVVRKIEASL